MILLNSQLQSHALENGESNCDGTEGKDLNQDHDHYYFTQQQPKDNVNNTCTSTTSQEKETTKNMPQHLVEMFAKFYGKISIGPVPYIAVGYFMTIITVPCEQDKQKHYQITMNPERSSFFSRRFHLNIICVFIIGATTYLSYIYALIRWFASFCIDCQCGLTHKN